MAPSRDAPSPSSSNSSSPSSSPPSPPSPPPPKDKSSLSPDSSPPAPPTPPSKPSYNSSSPIPSQGGGNSDSPPSRVSGPPPPARTEGDGRSLPSDNDGASNSRDSPSGGGRDIISRTNVKVIAGVAVGAGILIMLIVIICCVRRRKKRKDQFYGDSVKGSQQQYYESHQYPNWQNPQGHNQQSSRRRGGWGGGPPPPPPQMPTSGEDSSLYSGPKKPILPPPSPDIALGFNKGTFTYQELAAATGGFSQGNLLGQGGFGYVYKGVLPNGKEIAVKSLKTGSGQGEREFQAEVDIISRVHHRHLVSLVGYCIADEQRMLVYEFVPNNTMEYHLHGNDLPVMAFATRMRIALGSAKGLAYLHEDCHPRIIHRDIKSANILLDFNFEAKVADFGLAKLSSDTNTHVSTRVMGTFGYLAPEYASSGKLTEKSDVFSFGVVLLELITGKRPVDNSSSCMDDCLVDWARPLMALALENGNFDELADPRLELKYNPQEMARMVTCASASIRHSSRKRPKMSQILRALEGDVSLEDLNEGVKPGYSSIYGSGTSSDYNQSSYQADMKKFRQIALSSQESPSSSECGGSSNDSREAGNMKGPATHHY